MKFIKSVDRWSAALLALLWLTLGSASGFASSILLEGQDKNSSVWTSQNLQNWQELDYIPVHIRIEGGPVTNQTFVLTFPHLTGTTPGFQNFYNFTNTANLVLQSGPTLSAPASGTWTYTFVATVTNSSSATIGFMARLAAGAHLNTGSSLMISGSPQSMGQLQVHKPAAGPQIPDLAIVKTGSATVAQGGTISYTLSYTNQAFGTNTAMGAQISDILPPGVVVVTNSLSSNASVEGTNTIFWDLTNVLPHASGQVTFQVTVPLATPVGSTITNYSQILSADDDYNPADNNSSWLTMVTNGCTGVAITNSPVSATNCPGTPVTFSVGASGTSPFSYQWRKDTAPISGATNSSYTILSVSATDAGSYDVVVTNGCGNVTSSSATLVVNSNANVSSAPVSITNCPGTTASFSVTATGTGLSYQWYNGASLLNGETGSTLTINNVSAANAGTYSVVVSGVCGNAITNSASLTVLANANVSSAPVSVTNCPGTTASFSVTATGTGLSYQWYKGASLLNGETGSTLTLNNVSAANAGTYSVVVSGVCGNAITNSASLTVNANVNVSSAPVSITNCPATTASFSVTATGTGLSYQWYKGASLLNGETASTLTLNNVSAANAGTYSVVVSGVCGNAITNSASLTVNANVNVSSAPVSITNCPGTTANFSVTATGTGLSYQWYKGASLLNGETGSTLTLNNVSAANAGTYSVVVSGVCGNAITNSASLTVNANVNVSSAPVSITNCPGTTANFSVTATGTSLSYQWYKGASLLGGETASTLTINNVSAANAGTYSVVVSGVCGNAITNSASLTVNANVNVSSAPVSITNCPGTTANFSVSATGTGLSYQWYKGASLLNGETGSTLTINNVSAANAGTYSVVVSGVCGNAITNSASLTVNANAGVSSVPVSITNCPGTTASFSVTAVGTGVTYQWYKGAAALSNETNSTLTINNVSAANAGTYSVVVGGVCGTAITNSASLTVNQNVNVSSAPVSITNCPGTTAIFSVNATGTDLKYIWAKGPAGVLGTNSTLVVSNVTAASAGTYSVFVSGACGNTISNGAVLVVNANVNVSSAPVSITNCPGTTANFSVTASGTGLSYQWYKGASLLNGETGSTLTLNNVSAANAGTYSVVVSGVCGNAITNSASLTVNANVNVSTAPVSITNCPGTTASFSVSATGTGLSYQWYNGASLLNGETGSTLTINNVSAANAGTYSVVVSGVCGNAITNSASLTVNANVNVSTAPVSITNCPGTMASFSVNATGTGLSYQWYNGASLLNGETGSTLTINNVSAANAGTYSVVVSGVCGNAITNSALLVVNQNVSVAPLSGATKNIGDSFTFTAVASGTGPFSYQWYKGLSPLAGQTNSTLMLTNLQPSDAATYGVSVSGACGEAATSSAVLVLNQPPIASITTPTNNAVFVAPATFTVIASASDPDGTVTNVEFFVSTNGVDFTSLGAMAQGPYSVVVSNLVAGNYSFKAVATDNYGATGESTLVNVSVISGVPFARSTIHFTTAGYDAISLTVTNPTPYSYPALRVYVSGVPANSATLVNANGTNNNGEQYIDINVPVAPGVTVFTDCILYHVKVGGFIPNPTIRVEAFEGSAAFVGTGTPQAIDKGAYLNNGTFALQFTSVSNRVYNIQYSSNLLDWKTVIPSIKGNGTRILWIDSGPPATESFPTLNNTRYYRVIWNPTQ